MKYGQMARSSMPNGIAPQLLDLHQAAFYSGIPYWTLYALQEAGLIPTVRIPDPRNPSHCLRRILFSRQSLDAFIQAHESTSIRTIRTAKLKVRK